MSEHAEADVRLCQVFKERGANIATIYDVGSASGAWTLQIAPVFPDARFELFEPLWNMEPNYKRSRETLKQSLQNSRISPYALGETNGETEIHLFSGAVGSTTLPIGTTQGRTSVRVPVRSIDSLVSSSEYPVPDLLKLDIQGGELAALKGAENTLPHVQIILTKAWLQRAYGPATPLFAEIMQLLQPFQFHPYEISTSYRNEAGEAIVLDVAFINKNKALSGVLL